jgi:hypothetical protein
MSLTAHSIFNTITKGIFMIKHFKTKVFKLTQIALLGSTFLSTNVAGMESEAVPGDKELRPSSNLVVSRKPSHVLNFSGYRTPSNFLSYKEEAKEALEPALVKFFKNSSFTTLVLSPGSGQGKTDREKRLKDGSHTIIHCPSSRGICSDVYGKTPPLTSIVVGGKKVMMHPSEWIYMQARMHAEGFEHLELVPESEGDQAKSTDYDFFWTLADLAESEGAAQMYLKEKTGQKKTKQGLKSVAFHHDPSLEKEDRIPQWFDTVGNSSFIINGSSQIGSVTGELSYSQIFLKLEQVTFPVHSIFYAAVIKYNESDILVILRESGESVRKRLEALLKELQELPNLKEVVFSSSSSIITVDPDAKNQENVLITGIADEFRKKFKDMHGKLGREFDLIPESKGVRMGQYVSQDGEWAIVRKYTEANGLKNPLGDCTASFFEQLLKSDVVQELKKKEINVTLQKKTDSVIAKSSLPEGQK